MRLPTKEQFNATHTAFLQHLATISQVAPTAPLDLSLLNELDAKIAVLKARQTK
jgi:hypothetical protein